MASGYRITGEGADVFIEPEPGAEWRCYSLSEALPGRADAGGAAGPVFEALTGSRSDMRARTSLRGILELHDGGEVGPALDALTAWCGRWGLLGLLQSKVDCIRLPRRSIRARLRLGSQQSRRLGAAPWAESNYQDSRPPGAFGPSGYFATLKRLARDHFVGGELPTYRVGPLECMPTVGSPEFWPVYREPVLSILSYARRLLEAIDGLSLRNHPEAGDLEGSFEGGPRSKPTHLQKPGVVLSNARLWLNEELAETTCSVDFEPRGGRSVRIAAPSLASHLCFRVAESAVENTAPIRCSRDECRVFVYPSRRQRQQPNLRYCSDNCRNVMNQRARRARLKEDAR